MKKFGTRLISAVLAGCMMTSVLPVSAFAQGGGVQALKPAAILSKAKRSRNSTEREEPLQKAVHTTCTEITKAAWTCSLGRMAARWSTSQAMCIRMYSTISMPSWC